MNGSAAEIAYEISLWVVPVLIAITMHEAAHGFVAWRLGDDTAYRLGRVTFNPIKHIDRFGTIILPAVLLLAKAPFLFGYAKPVPVRFGNLRHPRRDMVLVAAADPAANLLLATVSLLLLHGAAELPAVASEWTRAMLEISFFVNVVLAVFNMLPLPPLDGGRVAVGLLPASLGLRLARLERWGMLILIGAIVILPIIGRQLGRDIDILSWVLAGPVDLVAGLLVALVGLL